MDFEIQIPVKRYVKKYLEKNSFVKQPFRLTTTDPIGAYIISLLEPVPSYYKGPTNVPYSVAAKSVRSSYGIVSTETLLLLKIKPHYARKKQPRFYINKNNLSAFNRYIDMLIKMEMVNYIESLSSYENVHTLINDFLDKYDFTPEDITFDKMKKYYQRWKKRKEQIDIQEHKNISTKLSHK